MLHFVLSIKYSAFNGTFCYCLFCAKTGSAVHVLQSLFASLCIFEYAFYSFHIIQCGSQDEKQNMLLSSPAFVPCLS